MKSINDFLAKYGVKVNHPYGFEKSTNCYAPFNNLQGDLNGKKGRLQSNPNDSFTCWRVDLKYPSPYLHIKNGSTDFSPSIVPYTVFGQVIEVLNKNQIVIFFFDNPYYYVLVDIDDIIGITVADYRVFSHLIHNIGRD